jgi:hypothetical protein
MNTDRAHARPERTENEDCYAFPVPPLFAHSHHLCSFPRDIRSRNRSA